MYNFAKMDAYLQAAINAGKDHGGAGGNLNLTYGKASLDRKKQILDDVEQAIDLAMKNATSLHPDLATQGNMAVIRLKEKSTYYGGMRPTNPFFDDVAANLKTLTSANNYGAITNIITAFALTKTKPWRLYSPTGYGPIHPAEIQTEVDVVGVDDAKYGWPSLMLLAALGSVGGFGYGYAAKDKKVKKTSMTVGGISLGILALSYFMNQK